MYYILNYIPAYAGHRKTIVQTIQRVLRAGETVDVFAPTFVEVVRHSGGVKRVERPLLFHYVFLKASEETAKRLCSDVEGFSFVIDRAGERRHLMISDKDVDAFRVIARLHGNKLPCFAIDDIQLEEGDKVEVVTGDFAGLTGTYMSRKGGKSGNILISVTQSVAAVVFDIRADYVRVLEFSKDSKRAYDQVDAFVPRLLDALEYHRGGHQLTPSLSSPLSVFCIRFSAVRIPNRKLEAKTQALLTAAATLIGENRMAEKAYEKYKSMEGEITNPWTRALCDAVVGMSHSSEALVARARKSVEALVAARPHLSAPHQLLYSTLVSRPSYL